MQFLKNLKEIEETEREDGPEKRADLSTIKVAINDVLHRFMPPSTTLKEVDCFALAVLQTIESAWDEHEAAPAR